MPHKYKPSNRVALGLKTNPPVKVPEGFSLKKGKTYKSRYCPFCAKVSEIYVEVLRDDEERHITRLTCQNCGNRCWIRYNKKYGRVVIDKGVLY